MHLTAKSDVSFCSSDDAHHENYQPALYRKGHNLNLRTRKATPSERHRRQTTPSHKSVFRPISATKTPRQARNSLCPAAKLANAELTEATPLSMAMTPRSPPAATPLYSDAISSVPRTVPTTAPTPNGSNTYEVPQQEHLQEQCSAQATPIGTWRVRALFHNDEYVSESPAQNHAVRCDQLRHCPGMTLLNPVANSKLSPPCRGERHSPVDGPAIPEPGMTIQIPRPAFLRSSKSRSSAKKSRGSRQQRIGSRPRQSLSLDDGYTPLGLSERRRTSTSSQRSKGLPSPTFFDRSSKASTRSIETSSSDERSTDHSLTPEAREKPLTRHRRTSLRVLLFHDNENGKSAFRQLPQWMSTRRLYSRFLFWFLLMVGATSLCSVAISNQTTAPSAPVNGLSDSGLDDESNRRSLVQKTGGIRYMIKSVSQRAVMKESHNLPGDLNPNGREGDGNRAKESSGVGGLNGKNNVPRSATKVLRLLLPSGHGSSRGFMAQDTSMYKGRWKKRLSGDTANRVVALHESAAFRHRPVQLYPADFTDNTQLYSILDSNDVRMNTMELREPYADGECVPMQEWQTTFHPLCNGMHELGFEYLGENNGNDVRLFGVKGFWRNAWKLDMLEGHYRSEDRDTVVLKTLKFQHTFEDAHFEHDRVDAVAMERLTSSPHVINVFGFCGHSVLTEYADGSRVGELADKSKKKPLVRLKIAADIANGLADVHGIDGDGNATFVHLDVNPANVVSIGGTLKLNDFNIGIIRKWNTTSNTPCGFPAQYPNPQWRSPEEARNEQNLTEKVDVFSMGHIFFRLICGHEPWNKLEPHGKPSKPVVNEKVQRGELPFIPDFVMNTTDKEVISIRDAMLRCYTYDPQKRPSAREIARSLEAALGSLKKEFQESTPPKAKKKKKKH